MSGADPQLCGGVPIFSDGAAVPVAVAEEVNRVCSDDAVSKGPEHFDSRRKLFAEVDRQIRGRVRDVLGDVILDFKRDLDQQLGLDALRKRVERVTDGLAADLNALDQQMKAMLDQRVEALLRECQRGAANAVLKAFSRQCTQLIAEECGRQISSLLLQRATPRAGKLRAKKKRKAR